MVKLHIRHSATPSALSQFLCDLLNRKLVAFSHPPLFSSHNGHLSALPNVLYAGFDPTADSLHVGNLLIVTSLLRSSHFGCKPIALIGGATAQIGDPSGHSTDRLLLPPDVIQENSKSLLRQLVELAENATQMLGQRMSLNILNNMDWYEKMSAIQFLRNAQYFRLAQMMKIGPIKARLSANSGITFTEFSYPIFQAYDWNVLSRRHNCYFQIGGSDQLGNLESGYDYILKQQQRIAYGVCLPLLTDSSGRKLGKSTLNDGCWLDERKTSPYAFYQYFRQLRDDLASKFLLYFSLKPLDEVEDILIEHNNNLGRWVAQTYLANEMTELVHGKSGLETAERCSRILFSANFEELKHLSNATVCSLFGGASTFQLPRSSIKTFGDFANKTRKDPRKSGVSAMKEGAFYVNGKRFLNSEQLFNVTDFLMKDQFTIVSWGKRKHFLVQWMDE